MSSSPECKSCGDCIHRGLVICEGCISKRLTTARDTAAREMREALVAAAKELPIVYKDTDPPHVIASKASQQITAYLSALPLPSETKETV